MKSRRPTCIQAILMLSTLSVPVGPPAQGKRDHDKHHHYRVIDMGTFGGPQSWVSAWDEFPDSMSNRGGLMGGADTSAPNPNYPNFNPFLGLPNVGYPLNSDPYTQHAFQSKHGALIDLGVLPDGYNSFAQWISGNGTVAGASENGVTDPLTGWPEVRAVLWDGGQPKDLGTFGGNESLAFAVNNRKQVVGMATNTISDPFGAGTQIRAFIWHIGSLGGPGSFPNDINNLGQVVGLADLSGGAATHGFFWDKKHGLVDLRTLGGTFSNAHWINDASDIVGVATTINDQFAHAALWRGLKIKDLGTLAGSSCSVAHSINAEGQIVGYADDCSDMNKHATLWENGGPPVDLNTLIRHGSSLHLLMAASINDRGEIGGQGADSTGNNHAFLLIPCDEHHPDIEGCDYSLVNVSPTPSAHATTQKGLGVTAPVAPWRHHPQSHFPSLVPRN